MEEKKTAKTKKSDSGSGLGGLLLDGVVRGIQSFVDGTLENIHRTVHSFVKKLGRRVFLFCFAFVGVVFLLVGVAQILSAMYRFPGSGEAIMGIFILLICLVVYAFERSDN